MSLLDHTPVRQPHSPERQARRSRHACDGSKSDRRLRHIHRKYAECGTERSNTQGGVKRHKKGNIIPKTDDIASVFLLFGNNGIKLSAVSSIDHKLSSRGVAGVSGKVPYGIRNILAHSNIAERGEARGNVSVKVRVLFPSVGIDLNEYSICAETVNRKRLYIRDLHFALLSVFDLKFYITENYAVAKNELRITAVALLNPLRAVILLIIKCRIIRNLKGAV